MIETKSPPLILPALRGVMGDWVYYVCLMDFDQLSDRVNFAKEIHQHEGLSTMIQRRLEGKRAFEIMTYLRSQRERFFNSLVVATYGREPNWHALSDVSGDDEVQRIDELTHDTLEKNGFLSFSGEEKIFVLDGQHRLAGIKKLNVGRECDAENDTVSVVFMGHKATDEDLRRTRRLFTTLNKTAVQVSKADIITPRNRSCITAHPLRSLEQAHVLSAASSSFIRSTTFSPSYRTASTSRNVDSPVITAAQSVKASLCFGIK